MTAPGRIRGRVRAREEIPVGKLQPFSCLWQSLRSCATARIRAAPKNRAVTTRPRQLNDGREGGYTSNSAPQSDPTTRPRQPAQPSEVPFVCFIHDQREGEEGRGREEGREGRNDCTSDDGEARGRSVTQSSLPCSLPLPFYF